MARLMSVAMTTQAVIERRKTVTRRKGWTFLKPGYRLTLCRKVMGRKPGEPLVRLAEVEVVSVRRERLRALTDDLDYGCAEILLVEPCRRPTYLTFGPDVNLPRLLAWTRSADQPELEATA